MYNLNAGHLKIENEIILQAHYDNDLKTKQKKKTYHRMGLKKSFVCFCLQCGLIYLMT